MARNKAIEERVKSLVAEMLAEEEGAGQLENINDIEDAMVRIGDLVAREFGVQALAAPGFAHHSSLWKAAAGR